MNCIGAQKRKRDLQNYKSHKFDNVVVVNHNGFYNKNDDERNDKMAARRLVNYDGGKL